MYYIFLPCPVFNVYYRISVRIYCSQQLFLYQLRVKLFNDRVSVEMFHHGFAFAHSFCCSKAIFTNASCFFLDISPLYLSSTSFSCSPHLTSYVNTKLEFADKTITICWTKSYLYKNHLIKPLPNKFSSIVLINSVFNL